MNAPPPAESARFEPKLPSFLLLNRNFVLLWLAAGVSAVGDHLSEMALIQKLGGLERPDVTRVQALMTFSFFLPFAVLGPLAGWWADRFSRRATMIGTDLLRATVLFSLTLAVPAMLAAGLGDYTLVGPLLLVGGFAAFFSPARQALLPTLIREDHLIRANALMSAIATIGAILSGWLGGKLVDLANAGRFDLAWNFYFSTATFLTSAVFLALMTRRSMRRVPHAQLAGVWAPMRDGFRYVATHRRVLQVILLGTVFWAAAGVVSSVVPAIVRDVFAGSFADVGMYRGLLAAGLAVGAGGLTIFGPAMPIPLLVLGALAGGAFWILALDAAFVFAVWGGAALGLASATTATIGKFSTGLSLFMIGIHGAALLVVVSVVIHRFVPDARRGRVFGVSDMATMAAITAAAGLLGLPHIPNLDRWVPYLLLVVVVGMLTALVCAWRVYRRGERIGAWASLLQKVVYFYCHFWSRLERVGRCPIPRAGPVIVAANHVSGIDPLLLEAASPRVISFIVAREHYRRPLAGWLMKQADCIPVDRENPGREFYERALGLLRGGGCLGVFPQGTFSPPGEPPRPARPGIATLALRTGTPVVPVHISGVRYSAEPFGAIHRRHRARVQFGRPIDVAREYAGRERDPRAEQELTERIMGAIYALAPVDPLPAERP